MNSELAWAAGFFDGEGNVYARAAFRKDRAAPYRVIGIAVGQSGDPSLLERFRRAVGCGKVLGPYRTDRRQRRDRYVFVTSGHWVDQVFDLLAPHLGPVKTAQFHRAFLVYASKKQLLRRSSRAIV